MFPGPASLIPVSVAPLQSLPGMTITKPEHAYRHLKHRISFEVEEFWAVALSSEKSVIGSTCLFRGTVDLCLFHPRDVFRFGYIQNASSLLVAHNHPSGNAMPSPEDAEITQQLLKAADFLKLPVVDHLILSGDKFYSFLADKVMRENVTDLSPSDRSLDLY